MSEYTQNAGVVGNSAVDVGEGYSIISSIHILSLLVCDWTGHLQFQVQSHNP